MKTINPLVHLKKKSFVFVLLTIASLGVNEQVKCQTTAVSTNKMGWEQLPQILKKIKPPKFANKEFKIADFGAIADGKTDCKPAVDKAISICSKSGAGKVVGLDYYYNRELKKNSVGKEIQFHYIWEDRENSGFSKLGNVIENLGARIYEVHNAPSEKDFNNLSIYIIVDPDTPQETAHPNYILDSSITKIADWVNNGGVLVLMANDKGNCEFEHLNNLAEKFGIHFNQVSRNRVEGNNFDMGKFDVFPKHPLFEGLKKIYLKEVSTLTLKSPAQAVLTDGGDVIMASSNYGKGFVFAVGDPWLYNEYISHMRLPDDFQNYLAGENLFKWLLNLAKVVKK